MGNPLIRARNILHPAYQQFHPGMCAPEWRWFWQLAVFAEPLWSQEEAGVWDYASWLPGSQVAGAYGYEIGPSGRRRVWPNTTNADYSFANNGSVGTNIRPQYFQPNDATVFAVVNVSTFAAADHIVAWEGANADDGTANSNSCLNVSLQNTNTVIHFHESGTGTNNNVAASNGLITAGTRFSLAVTRTIANKTISFYKDGLFFSSGTYTTDCALGNQIYVDIGDRQAGTPTLGGAIECVYLFKTALTPAMIVQLNRDPWGPFRSAYGRSSGTGGGGGGGTTARAFVAGFIG